jgi:hypothetical protein
MSSRVCRCANGCSRFRSLCAFCLPPIPNHSRRCCRSSTVSLRASCSKFAHWKRDQAHSGAVTLIQRFGSAANLNIHLHCLVLDGVYRCSEGAPAFHEVRAPNIEQLHDLLDRIIARIIKWLTRQGYLIEEEGRRYLGEIDADRALTPLQTASCTYRIALGPSPGHKLLSLHTLPGRAAASTQSLCANAHGFSLHAAVRCGAHQRKRLERLCRYITRPAIANERLQRNRASQVVLQLRSPWRDGTTHIVMSPLQFMQRVGALVPRPRLHLIRFHGVLAPHAKLRAPILACPTQQTTEHAAHPGHAHGSAPTRIGWARLLKRVFEIDIELCPGCGARLKIIAAIVDPQGIVQILTHLGLPARTAPITGVATRSVPSGLI